MIRNNPTLKPSKLRRRRRKIFAIKSFLVFLAFVGLVFLFSWLSKIPPIQIENIEVSGNSTLSKEEIVNIIRTETSTKYFKLFSKNSIFLYPKKSIVKTLVENFKKIETLSIKSEGLKALLVSMNERKPDSLWCLGSAKDGMSVNNNSGTCYFLDKKGFIFSKAPDFSGNSFLRYYGLIGVGEEPIGKNYMIGEKFREVSRFIGSLEILGIKVSTFRAETENDYEIILKNGIRIILDDKNSLDRTLENIQSILSEVDLKGDYSVSNPPKINYVDLRFGNKIYLNQLEN